MQKRGSLLFLSILLISTLFANVVLADSSVTDEVLAENPDAQIKNAGLKPGDFFYFVDQMFNSFQSDISQKEEYMAEIFELLEEGKTQEAKQAFETYKEFSKKVEKEISPSEREEARKSAAAILKELERLEGEVEGAEDIFDEVKEEESDIVTAAEIASKIEELCSELHESGNYELFYKTCKTEDDSPEWQKELYDDFTDEQVKEAETFIKKISVCFEDASKCPCEEFENKEFSSMCSKIAPLVAACEAGDEKACREEEQMDFDPSEVLPPHIVAALEEKFGSFDEEDNLPEECLEEGIESMDECEMMFFEEHAPQECVEAFNAEGLKIGEDLSTEDAHKFCEKVLYELYTPIECQEKNLDEEECSIVIFKENSPQECLDAGLTGKDEDDHEKCNDIMEGLYEIDEEYKDYVLGIECQEIENAEERLNCYDAALGNGEYYKDEYYDGHEDYPEYFDEKGEYTDEYYEEYESYKDDLHDEYEDYKDASTRGYSEDDSASERYAAQASKHDEYEDYLDDLEDDREDEEDREDEKQEEPEQKEEEKDDQSSIITGNVIATSPEDNPYVQYVLGWF